MISQQIKDKFEQGFKHVIIHPKHFNDEYTKELKEFGFDIWLDIHSAIGDFYITDGKPLK